MAPVIVGYGEAVEIESSDEAEPLVAASTATPVACASTRRAVKTAALTLAASSVVYAVLSPAALQLQRPSGGLTAMSTAVGSVLALVAEGPAPVDLAGRGASNITAAAPSEPPASITIAPQTVVDAAAPPTTTTQEVCRDTPGWTNGFTACNNYHPVDPDCTDEGVTCHFYQRKPHFCQKGMNNPWQHCCVCGGGSTFDGHEPTTTERMLRLPHIHGMPHLMRHMHMPTWGKKLSHDVSHKLGSLEHKLSEKMKPVETAVGEVYEGINRPDYNQYPELGGNSVEDINANALRVFLGVAGVTTLGFFLDPFFARCRTPGRPKLWSLGLLCSSYALLIPGLSSVVLSFDIIANIVGHRVNLQPDVTQDTCTESVWGMIRLLYDMGSMVGAELILFYAMIVPAVKLLLLATGELLRFSPSRCGVMVARTCILSVQHISKWASPDMFAYIMLVHLIRDLDHFPLILTAGRLDEGFTCFSIFCVCSTISSLGIGVPKLPTEENKDDAVPRLRQPLLLCLAGRGGAVAFVALLAVVFAVLFGIGLQMPCMSLRIDEGRLYPPRGPLPYSAKPVVEALSIPDLLNSDISLWKCMVFLAGEITSGEANSVFALVLWAIFVVAFTITDMVLLVLAALRLRWPAGTVPAKDAEQPCCGPRMLRPCPFMSIARVLRKLSMLDVSIMGVLVMCYSLKMYAKDGIVVVWRQGLVVLAVAESIHMITFYLVSGAVDHAITQDSLLAESEEPSMPSRCQPRFNGCGCTRARKVMEDRDDDPSVPGQRFSLTCCSANRRPFKSESGKLIPAQRTGD